MKKCFLSVLAAMTLAGASAQWQPQNAGFSKDTLGFYEISIPNAHTAWAICYDAKPNTGLGRGRFVLDFTRTTNGGTTWKPGKVGNDNTLQYANISAISESEAWVAMNKRFLTGGGLYHTTDSGATWTHEEPGVVFGANSFPDFVHFKDKNHGLAMGDPDGIGNSFEIYTTNNKGKKWKRVDSNKLPAALPGEYGWISGFATVGDTIWFGTTSGRVFKSVDFGKSWNAYTVDPTGSKFVMEIAFDDDGLHGLANLRASTTEVYATSDGGLSWTNLGQPLNWKSSRITSVPGTDAMIATSVNGFDFGSSISYDFGATWTVLSNAIPMAVCRFYSPAVGYAGSFFVTGPPLRGGIFKSTINFEQGNTASRSSLGMTGESNTGDAIKIYPSPANDVVNITLPDAPAASTTVIYLLSMDGKLLQSKKTAGGGQVQLQVADVVPGIYTLRVASGTANLQQTITISR
jgi:photosystem II stability/assembly factor-like uncharacterized protein